MKVNLKDDTVNNGNTDLIFDTGLIKKYNRPGPRYTSYPTALRFHDGITSNDVLSEIERSVNKDVNKEISLYFHIPFCDTLCYFCGCNMMVSKDVAKKRTYIDYLKSEIDLVVSHINPDSRVVQVHWGGGTPSNLSPAMIEELAWYTNDKFEVDAAAEISVEIDPRELTLEHMEAFRNGGFNRVSMGVQDFNTEVQKAVNRIQPEYITRQAIEWSRDLGFESINTDLMYGLPYQSVNSFSETVDIVIDIDPDRIAVFNYAHVPWIKKHQTLISEEHLPSPDEKLALFKMVTEKLIGAGYIYIGMDHFAKPDDELFVAQRNGSLRRNFQGYTTRKGCDLIAMGITGISEIGDVYAQNTKELKEYYETLKQKTIPTVRGYRVSPEDKLRRAVITELMCHFQLTKADIEEKFCIDFDEHFRRSLDTLDDMEGDGLLERSPEGINVLPKGRLLIRNIAMAFDEYLPAESDARYSRTI